MPRKARIDTPGALHHIIGRGIERRNIFKDDKDRDNFLNRLGNILLETETPCFAWALMPNHFHLLLRTGNMPISTIMRRLLTGYVVTFNLRHSRSGRLFQNRYKSILCQEDTYFLELVRYLHLNPLRANIVWDVDALDSYPYCGHSRLMGRFNSSWQNVNYVLSLFENKPTTAIKKYRQFLERGLALGKRPDLTGGGLIRSVGGWNTLKSLRRMQGHLKGDERILGDSDFVQEVLNAANENMEKQYRLKAKGYDFDKILEKVGKLFNLKPENLLVPSKQHNRVKARSLICYWAVKKIGISSLYVAAKLGIKQPSVSRAAIRGEKICLEDNFHLDVRKKS
jgi:putative transposase